MIDPMADLGSSGDTANDGDAKDVFDPNALGQNMQRIDKVRSFMGIISGCLAGIFGFTGLEGLGKYNFSNYAYPRYSMTFETNKILTH